MKIIHKFLDRFGYLLFNKEYHRSKYMRKNEVNTLEQVFSRNYHNGFNVLLIGDEERFRNEPVYQLLKEKAFTLDVFSSLSGLEQKIKHRENVSPIDLLVVNSSGSVDPQLDDKLISSLNPGILILDHGYPENSGAEKVTFGFLQVLLRQSYKVFIHNYDLIAYH